MWASYQLVSYGGVVKLVKTGALQASDWSSNLHIATKRVIKKKRRTISAKAIGVRKVKNRPVYIGM